ncbi:lipopeptide mating pheromone precursor bbp2-6 [Schizophyllum commune]
MSAAASTTSNRPASAAKRGPAVQALVISAADSPSTSTSDAPQSPSLGGSQDSSTVREPSSSIGGGHGSGSQTPTAARALTPRGGYYLNRSTGRIVSWAELKDMEQEGEGNMTYFCAVM